MGLPEHMRNRYAPYLAIAGSLFLSALAATAQTDSIVVGSLQRTYTVRLPSAYDGTTPLPLVVAMHGGFGSGTQLEGQSQLTVKAEAEGFIVVYPDGVASPIGIRTWNAGGCCGYAMNNGIDDVGFIGALLDTLFADLAIDTQRVYATGMSNGGFMSYRLACELSERIAAIAPVSATMTIDVCAPTRSVPVIALHSYLDTSVPYLGGIGDGISDHYNAPMDSVQNAFAAHANCMVLNDTILNNAEMTVIEWRDCDCGQEVITYMTQDGGHSWPGGVGTGPGDPPSTVISANDLMWDFFEQYTLDCTTTGVERTAAPTELTLYPNPATVSGTLTGRALVRMALVDLSGRTLMLLNTPPTDVLHLDLTALVPGVYLVQADALGGHRSVVRLVRQ